MDFTSDTATLTASINASSQRNYCKWSKAEFKCVSSDGLERIKSEKGMITTLTELSPYTNYKCYVRVQNSADAMGEMEAYSSSSEERPLLTKEGSKLHKICG
jgi:hypothetical protein